MKICHVCQREKPRRCYRSGAVCNRCRKARQHRNLLYRQRRGLAQRLVNILSQTWIFREAEDWLLKMPEQASPVSEWAEWWERMPRRPLDFERLI